MTEQPESEELEKLLDAATAVFRKECRKFFLAGHDVGYRRGHQRGKSRADQTREVLRRLLEVDGDEVDTEIEHLRDDKEDLAEPAPQQKAAKEYGAISGHVRSALRAMKDLPGGVSPVEVKKHLDGKGLDIDIGQIRTSLKVLAKQKEAVRIERGKYTVGPKMADTGESKDLF